MLYQKNGVRILGLSMLDLFLWILLGALCCSFFLFSSLWVTRDATHSTMTSRSCCCCGISPPLVCRWLSTVANLEQKPTRGEDFILFEALYDSMWINFMVLHPRARVIHLQLEVWAEQQLKQLCLRFSWIVAVHLPLYLLLPPTFNTRDKAQWKKLEWHGDSDWTG